MMDKVQKIKDWISKTQDGLMDAQGNFEYPEHEVAYHILCNLDAYIDSLQEKSVSDELEKAADEYVDGENPTCPCEECLIKTFKAGANWQKEQDQETIELAEDHAMLAGMEKMKEQMMANAVDSRVYIDAGGYPYIPQMELYDYDKDIPLAKEGDKYKVVLIKEE